MNHHPDPPRFQTPGMSLEIAVKYRARHFLLSSPRCCLSGFLLPPDAGGLQRHSPVQYMTLPLDSTYYVTAVLYMYCICTVYVLYCVLYSTNRTSPILPLYGPVEPWSRGTANPQTREPWNRGIVEHVLSPCGLPLLRPWVCTVG